MSNANEISSIGSVSEFGLVPKSSSGSNGEQRVLNFKLKVAPDFYERWNTTFEKLGTRYNGGGSAVMLKTIERLLPQLEAIAQELPESDEKSGTKPAGKGGAV